MKKKLKDCNSSSAKFNQAGFTMAEIIVVIFIFITITTLVLASFRRGEQRAQFLLVTEQIASDIRGMQIQTLTGIIEEEIVATGGHGLYFDTDQNSQYILFRDNGDEVYDVGAGDVILETVQFPENFSLSSLTTNPLTIVFKPPKPTIYINGEQSITQIQITLLSDKVDDKNGSVTINRVTGRVTAELVEAGGG